MTRSAACSGANAAKHIGSINIKSLNASAEIKGNVIITSRPKFAAAWHLEPNLAAQVLLGDTNLAVAGARVNVPAQVKPLIDKTVGEQLKRPSSANPQRPHLRAERAGAMGESLPLDPAAGRGPNVVAAGALARDQADPRDRGAAARRCHAVTLTVGIEAETRITASETKPDCPFPDKIIVVPPTPGGVTIGVPIDIPFTDINKILEAQFAGRTFPGGRLRPGRRHRETRDRHRLRRPAADLASGPRQGEEELLRVRRRRHRAHLGQARARPDAADPAARRHRTRRRIGSGVRTARRRGARGDAASAKGAGGKATVDLKPFAANAQQKIAAAIADFQKNENGVRVTAEITNLRLADIAFDSKTLRVIAEAEGAINVSVTALPGL